MKEHYLKYDLVDDVTDKQFVEYLGLEEKDLYYSILQDTDWDETRSQKILEDGFYLDHRFLLDYLDLTEEKLIEEGLEVDYFVDVVYDRGIEKLKKEGFIIFESCGDSNVYAYRLK